MGFFKKNESKDIEFNATKKIGIYFLVDEENKQWVIPDGFMNGKIKNARIHSYSDIIDFELLEDGTSVAKGGLGRAVVGGLLFGGVGAVVGGVTGGKKANEICTNLKVKITVKDMDSPTEYINLITTPTKKSGIIYKSSYSIAQNILSLLQVMCDNVQVPVEESISVADELKKFKELLDSGAITQEEFDNQKAKLLSL